MYLLVSLVLFDSECILRRLLQLLFIKRFLCFLSIITSYFICHWNCQLNLRNFKNLFRPSLRVTFIKCFRFLCYSNIITNRKFCCQGLTIKSHFIFVFLTTCFLRSHVCRRLNSIIALIYK